MGDGAIGSAALDMLMHYMSYSERSLDRYIWIGATSMDDPWWDTGYTLDIGPEQPWPGPGLYIGCLKDSLKGLHTGPEQALAGMGLYWLYRLYALYGLGCIYGYRLCTLHRPVYGHIYVYTGCMCICCIWAVHRICCIRDIAYISGIAYTGLYPLGYRPI